MKSLPFLIDALKYSEDRVEINHELDMELGAVMFLVENFRAGSGRILDSRKKGVVRDVLKVAWPMYMAQVSEEEYVFIDGLKSFSYDILTGLTRSPDEIQNQVSGLEPEEYHEVLKEIRAFTEAPERVESVEGLFKSEIFNGLKKFAKSLVEEHKFVVKLPSLLPMARVKELQDLVATYPERMDTMVANCDRILEVLRTKQEDARARTDKRIEQITAEYDRAYGELEPKVQAAIQKAKDNEEAETQKAADLRNKEKEKLIQQIKDATLPFKDSLDQMQATWGENKAKVEACTTEEQIKEEINVYTTLMQQKSGELQRAISKINADLNDLAAEFSTIDAEYERKVQELQAITADREREETAKLEALTREKDAQIKDLEALNDRIAAIIEECAQNLQTFTKRKDQNLQVVENFRTVATPRSKESIVEFYFPFYYLTFDDEGTRVSTILPPTILGTESRKKDEPVSYNQKELPLTVADESFLQFYKDRFQTLLDNNAEIGGLIRESLKSVSLNLVASFDFKGEVDKGLTFLKGRNLGKDKHIDKAQANINEYFRT